MGGCGIRNLTCSTKQQNLCKNRKEIKCKEKAQCKPIQDSCDTDDDLRDNSETFHCQPERSKHRKETKCKEKPQCKPTQHYCDTDDDLSGSSEAIDCQKEKIKCKPSACCKPGCSVRMPCLTCSKNGVKAVNTKTVLPKKCERTTRSRCETRSKSCNRIVPEDCGDARPKAKNCKIMKAKSCEKIPSRCETEALQSGDERCGSPCSPSPISEISLDKSNPRSRRNLKACPCNSCKNVKFKNKCDVIPARSCDESCDESDNMDSTASVIRQPAERSRISLQKRSCTPQNFSGRLEYLKTFCSPQEDAECQCGSCLQRTSSETVDVSLIRATMTQPSFPMPTIFENPAYPPNVVCPCGSPNCSSGRSMRKY